MDAGLEVAIDWWDDDVVILRVRASNGRFAGTTKLYAGHQSWLAFAEVLRDFPVDSSDAREYQLGTFDPSYAGGGISVKFFCTDGVGHTAVAIRIYGTAVGSDQRAETANFAITIEASAVDSFVQQLRGMELRRGASAFLSGVKSN